MENMMKKLCTCLLALLFVLGSCAIAEGPVLLWEASNIEELSNPAPAVIVYEYGKGYGLMTLDGQEILPIQYNRITNSYCQTGYYIAVSGEGVNCSSLIDQTGKILTEEGYGDIQMLSDKWVVALKLVLTTDEQYDYWAFGSSDHFNVERCDIIYLPTGSKVATLTREQYHSATAFGDYLLLRDRNDAVQLYDAQFQPVESAFTAYYQSEFYITDKGEERDLIVSRITGETIAQGYEYIEDTFSGKIISVSIDGSIGLIDSTGAVLLPCEYEEISDSNSRYLTLERDGLVGLYDLDTLQIILPCEYDSFLDPSYEAVCYNGYFLVMKDDKFGYANETGITCPVEYTESEATLLGSSFVIQNEDDSFTLVAADGVVTPLPGVTTVHDTINNSFGHYIILQNADGLWGVVDWHGNTVVDYSLESAYDVDFIDKTHLVIDSNYMYVIK